MAHATSSQTFSRTISYPSSFYSHLPAYEDGTDSVPKRRHINSRRRVITQKKTYNIVFTYSFYSSTENLAQAI